MSQNLWKTLVNNAAMLLALFVILENSPQVWKKRPILRKISNGIFVAIICIAIMSMPFELYPGLVFDTRTILISVAALVFGGIPVSITVVAAAIFRIIAGGSGTIAGLATIITSAAIGLIWRRWVYTKHIKRRWLSIYFMSLSVHITMLACMFLLPYPTSLNVIRDIALPVIIIYPIASVSLSMLLLNQKERKENQEKLVQSEEKFRYVFDNSAIGNSLTLLSGEVQVNNTFCSMLGYTKEELKGKLWQTLTHPDDIDNSQKEIDKLLNGEKDYITFEKRYLKKDGSILFAHVNVSIRKDMAGKPIYFMTSIIDITEKKKIENEWQKFFLLAESSSEFIGMCDLNMNPTYVNPAGQRMVGFSDMATACQVKVQDYFFPEDIKFIEEEFFPRTLREGNGDVEIRLRHFLTGEPIWMYYNLFSVNDESDTPIGWATVSLDITERKIFEKEKARLDAMLNHQQRLKSIGTLASGVAHEINNPINGIMNYGQLILESSIGNKENIEYAKEIIHEGERIAEIVKNLLQFSRSNKQQHSYASVNDIINSTLTLIKTVILRDQIDLQVDILEDLPKLKCRSQQIQQVLMNLLTNARDASNEKYKGYNENKIIKLYSEMYNENNRRWLRLTIEDHGNGIPQKVQKKIFDPFFSTKSRDEGTGLGLSISYGIVKDHHGELTFETEEGLYTKFYLDLPFDNGWELEDDL